MRSRWMLIAVGLLVAALALGAAACDDDDDDGDDGDEPVATEPIDAGDGEADDGEADDGEADDGEAPASLELTLTEVGGSGVSGTAMISATNGDLEVVITGEGLDPTASYLSGVYDSTSATCMGGIIGAFSAEFAGSDGGTTYTVPGTLDQVFSVSIRADGGAIVVACGELSE